jgi:hypothetical protein
VEPKRGEHTGHGKSSRPRPAKLNIYFARSEDDARSFGQPLRVNDDPDGPEHRFPTLAVDSAGTVFVVWLDKRQGSPERPGFSRVYVAKSTDGGRSFHRNADATAGQEAPICHCCRIAAVADRSRGLFIAFRNDIEDLRDIFLIRTRTADPPFERPAAIEGTEWYVPS